MPCPQAGQAFPFFQQQKKGNKKCRRSREITKKQDYNLKSANSLRSNNADFLTIETLFF
jgi:hypothetical protein